MLEHVAGELKIRYKQVADTIKLLDDGNTVPFIARYRKEVTGGLDEEQIFALQQQVTYQRNLVQRKEEVLRSIEEQGKLTPELEQQIRASTKLQQVEDLYRPYKPKRNTRGSKARDAGLEPLAQTLVQGELEPLVEAEKYINEQVPDVEAALQGARDIIAEEFADAAHNRVLARRRTWDKGVLVVKASDAKAESPYEMYYDFSEPVAKLPPHRVLAINRGEKEEFLKVSLDFESQYLLQELWRKNYSPQREDATDQVRQAMEDGYQRLLAPAVERDIRRELTDNAHQSAYKLFSTNLTSLLLQPPTRGKTVLGVDPAYRTGCKLAVVDATGKLLEVAVIYPTPPKNQVEQSKRKIKEFIDKYGIEVIAIGNGTASRETTELIGELTQEVEGVGYTVVDESGASVYSAAPLAKEEFPELDVSERSAVSIARRLQDPLAELVKVPPQAIGVGQYQHDVDQKQLGQLLGEVVETCVNRVGADLNTASAPLLSYIAGIKPAVAKAIVAWRQEEGSFTSRNQLKKVPRLGDATFQQCAGFLRIREGENPLDATSVHPESYDVAEKLLGLCGYSTDELAQRGGIPELSSKLPAGVQELAQKLGVGEPTLKDIIQALEKPALDPRDKLPAPLFREGVLTLEDLKEGMILQGTVRNVVDFGAFVDIGVKEAGLVHVSELADKFVKHPLEVVKVGENISVRVIGVDTRRRRIALSCKAVH
ncbi:MAG: RNA-binding transcriptional accessory protein [Firmicutes bacterium]|nr:RNA-binding transcriptional accessory protein [Bacillota bacterium]